jgi:hypothetical protein
MKETVQVEFQEETYRYADGNNLRQCYDPEDVIMEIVRSISCEACGNWNEELVENLCDTLRHLTDEATEYGRCKACGEEKQNIETLAIPNGRYTLAEHVCKNDGHVFARATWSPVQPPTDKEKWTARKWRLKNQVQKARTRSNKHEWWKKNGERVNAQRRQEYKEKPPSPEQKAQKAKNERLRYAQKKKLRSERQRQTAETPPHRTTDLNHFPTVSTVNRTRQP